MSYIENVKIKASDSPTIDAFARLRTSEPFTIFDSKQLYDKAPLFWGEVLGAGATSVHLPADARTRLTVPATNGIEIIRQTKQSFNYQPGKSQLIFLTGLFSQETNVEKEIGLHNGTNGISFLVDGTTAADVSWRITKNSVVNEVTKSNWNIDKFDGTGPSGITLDLNQTQILYIDFEWLGVGRVRCGFVVDGIPYIAHEFYHANRTNNPSVYMSSPNLPIRYRIKSTGGSGSLDHICSSIMSEGGQENNGVMRSVDNSATAISVNSGVIRPIIAMRIQSTKRYTTIIPQILSIIGTANTNFRWGLALNPTSSTGTDFTTGYTAVTNSNVEFKTAFAGTITDEGTVISSGYATTASRGAASEIESFLRLGYDIGTTTDDVLVLFAHSIGTNNTYLSSITYREIV